MGTSDRYVVNLGDIDQTQIAVVGGKAAHLGALSRIDGIRVPPGVCVTTEAFQRIMADAPSAGDQLDQLSRLQPDDRQGIRALSSQIREAIEGIPAPDDVASAITSQLAPLGEHTACAVRSSATAEDLPTASFAGQQDTYLNVVGSAAILRHVSRCWASLFTERAVTYRMRNGIHHRDVRMAVVVQQMVFPHASGVLFTADPVTGNRTTTSVEATVGLGEALVSGLVDPDAYTVRDGRIVDRAIGTKARAIVASPAGGTEERAIEPDRQRQPTLTDAQVVELAQLGRRIEAHLGHPQDIEWCLDDEGIAILQSRPITTLFPVPDAGDDQLDEVTRVYVSVGHQQMMTDPMRPLGISVWQLTSPAPMRTAAGRVFVDVTSTLASPASRDGLVEAMRRSDPLIGDALQTILDRGDVIRPLPDEGAGGPPPGGPPAPIDTDPAIVTRLIEHTQASLAAVERDLRTLSGPALLDFIVEDLQALRQSLFSPQSLQVVMAGMEAARWLTEHLESWLGEKNAADTLAQSAPNNVTSEMGLALLDVADVIRQHPDVVAFLQQVQAGDDGFLDELVELPGGRESRDAIQAYLDAYGMRCVGEIDITRPRWRERPTALVPMILSNVRNFEPGAAARRVQHGLQEARRAEQELLERLRALPDGQRKADEAKRMIDRVRAFIGYREYPKYGMVSRYSLHKQALLAEGDRLVQADVLRERDDIYYLTISEIQDVVRTQQADDQLIRRRREAFRSHAALTPPRVMTSDGEIVTGAYRRDDVPAGALVGLPVSAGTVEGRARVVLDMAAADLQPGDVLVTTYTDPSWTPAFVAITGLVTEVGGLMTHGAVIAREYGLPAVVGVERATQLIRDGQRIRVHGTDGYVEVLSPM